MPVINFKDYGSVEAIREKFSENWRYVGRPNPRYGLQGSPLANPYRIDDRTDRKTAVELYKSYLWGKIKAGDPAVLDALREINEDTAIVCWCAPKACHGDVLERAALWLRLQDAGNGRVDRLAAPAVLKAITLWEPWATLMALGLKKFETRSWGTDHRGPLAIHSAKRKVNWGELNSTIIDTLAAHGYTESNQFPYGSILAIGNMTGCYRTPADGGQAAHYNVKAQVGQTQNGPVVHGPAIGEGIIIPPPEPELYFGNYEPGRFAWHVPDAKAIKPVECRGMQQLWTVPEEPALVAWGRYRRAMTTVAEPL